MCCSIYSKELSAGSTRHNLTKQSCKDSSYSVIANFNTFF